MKKLLLIALVLFCEMGIACSGFPHSFCYTHASRPNDLVVKGIVISGSTNSIQLQILEILKGVETRTVITIWDGKDYDCNGAVSMKASGMASVGDTIVTVLPKIQAVQNAWDVVGDYSRPLWLFHEPVLKIKNDTLRGIIVNQIGTTGPPLTYWELNKMNYAEFKTYWVEHQTDCSMLYTGIKDVDNKAETVIRQDGTKIHVFIANAENQNIRIISIEGKIINEFKASGESNFDIEDYASGVYLISVSNKDGKHYQKKVIR